MFHFLLVRRAQTVTEVEVATFSAVSSVFSLSHWKIADLTDSTVSTYISVTICKNETVGVLASLCLVLLSKSGQVGEKTFGVGHVLVLPKALVINMDTPGTLYL